MNNTKGIIFDLDGVIEVDGAPAGTTTAHTRSPVRGSARTISPPAAFVLSIACTSAACAISCSPASMER